MPSIIIVGVGPLMSLSLSRKLAALGWDIALISRSEDKLKMVQDRVQEDGSKARVLARAADAGRPAQLREALDWAKKELSGKVDVLCYNAARVGPNDLMDLDPATMEDDFKTSATGTLVAGQWFAKNANTERVADGEWPVFLVPASLLHQNPFPSYASLSTVKSASYNLSLNFAHVLPEKFSIQVGMPLVVEPIIPRPDGTYMTKSTPDVCVEKVFMPFFEQRLKVGKEPWTREHVF